MNTQQRKLQINRCLHIIIIIAVLFLVVGVTAIYIMPKIWPNAITNIFAIFVVTVAFSLLIYLISSKYSYTRKLVVYTSSDLRGKSVSLYKNFITPLEIFLSPSACYASIIARQPINGVDEYIAVFRDLKPGRYTVSFHSDRDSLYAHVTIQEKITEVDWR